MASTVIPEDAKLVLVKLELKKGNYWYCKKSNRLIKSTYFGFHMVNFIAFRDKIGDYSFHTGNIL